MQFSLQLLPYSCIFVASLGFFPAFMNRKCEIKREITCWFKMKKKEKKRKEKERKKKRKKGKGKEKM